MIRLQRVRLLQDNFSLWDFLAIDLVAPWIAMLRLGAGQPQGRQNWHSAYDVCAFKVPWFLPGKPTLAMEQGHLSIGQTSVRHHFFNTDNKSVQRLETFDMCEQLGKWSNQILRCKKKRFSFSGLDVLVDKCLFQPMMCSSQIQEPAKFYFLGFKSLLRTDFVALLHQVESHAQPS